MPEKMTREEFDRVSRAIAQAAQMLPALDYDAATELLKDLDAALAEHQVADRHSPRTLEQVRAMGELIMAAAEFKRVADRVFELGLSPQEIPLEEAMTADDRPAEWRQADRKS